MNEEILSEIRNKLTAPRTALEKLARGENVPKKFLELAKIELEELIEMLEEKKVHKAFL